MVLRVLTAQGVNRMLTVC